MRLGRLRKLGLTAHVTCSVGWLGAVLAFLVLAVLGLTSSNARTVGAHYVAMDSIARLAILPLSLASLLTGVVQSLGTAWGLLRHYWILFKLIINGVASLLLLVHLRPIELLAHAATAGTLSESHSLKIQVAVDAGAALVALLVATALAVYKPSGVTPFVRGPQFLGHAAKGSRLDALNAGNRAGE